VDERRLRLPGRLLAASERILCTYIASTALYPVDIITYLAVTDSVNIYDWTVSHETPKLLSRVSLLKAPPQVAVMGNSVLVCENDRVIVLSGPNYEWKSNLQAYRIKAGQVTQISVIDSCRVALLTTSTLFELNFARVDLKKKIKVVVTTPKEEAKVQAAPDKSVDWMEQIILAGDLLSFVEQVTSCSNGSSISSCLYRTANDQRYRSKRKAFRM